MDRKQTEARLIEKAQGDEVFRRRLIDDPAGAISSELGMAIPPRLKLTVIEETNTNLYLVLPAREAHELNEAELAAVAGGKLAEEAKTLADKANDAGKFPKASA